MNMRAGTARERAWTQLWLAIASGSPSRCDTHEVDTKQWEVVIAEVERRRAFFDEWRKVTGGGGFDSLVGAIRSVYNDVIRGWL